MFYSILIISDFPLNLPDISPYTIKQVPSSTPWMNHKTHEDDTGEVIITDHFQHFDVLWEANWVVTNANFETSCPGVYAIGPHVYTSKTPQEQVDWIIESLIS
jgi:hypothetical protein